MSTYVLMENGNRILTEDGNDLIVLDLSVIAAVKKFVRNLAQNVARILGTDIDEAREAT